MVQLADIVAKDAAAANVTFVGLQPAAGTDNAIWRATAKATFSAGQPFMVVKSARNASGSARKLEGTIGLPVYDTTNPAKPVLVGSIPFNFNATLADILSDAQKADFAAYVGSLVSSAKFAEMLKAGFSAV